MRILVTGATGVVGSRIVSALIEAGCLVRTLSLDALPMGAWPDGVDVRLGDVTDMAVNGPARYAGGGHSGSPRRARISRGDPHFA